MNYTICLIFTVCMYVSLYGLEESMSQKNIQEDSVETFHSVKIQGKELRYKATAGQIHLKDGEGKVKATFFYIAYTKDGIKNSAERPLTFCFNGGPGSSSVWLHIGLLGPMRVALDEQGRPLRPYQLIENEFTLLDHSDLVFIDPISTGYSRHAYGEDPKRYHGYDEDIRSIAEFIRLYTTRNDRWTSPKFLIGESYGTTRAAGLALHLHENYNMYFSGLVFVSTALNYQTFRFNEGNDLPYSTHLPSYTAAAWYHGKISHEKYPQLEQLLKDSENFAYGQYASALILGEKMTDQERTEVVKNLALFSGLSEEYITHSRLRIPVVRFVKALLRDSERTLGRFDSRVTGIDYEPSSVNIEYDPSMDLIFGAFTSVFNHYVRADLNWMDDQEYKVLTNVFPWDWGKAKGCYLNVVGDLREVMSRNPRLKVLLANGIYDLAIPYSAVKYTFEHIDLDSKIRDNLTLAIYHGGHMMYTHKPTLVQMKQDLSQFYDQALRK